MGYSGGSEIYKAVATEMRHSFGDEWSLRQEQVLSSLIQSLEWADCDTLDEGFGISAISDRALMHNGYERPY